MLTVGCLGIKCLQQNQVLDTISLAVWWQRREEWRGINGATYLRRRAVVALETMNRTFSSAAECEPTAPSCTKRYLPSLRKRRT
jgi:hypothetical protein